MTTLIAVYNSEGCVGRCDARCYDAKTSKCSCICGGKNHRSGKAAAMANVGEMVGLSREDRERFANDRGLEAGKLVALSATMFVNMRKARDAGTKMAGQPDLFCEAI